MRLSARFEATDRSRILGNLSETTLNLPKHNPFNAVLVSVGGSVAPVLHVLHQHRPALVWYFCSDGSRALADQIQARLDWHPQARFIEVERFEELGPCYRELRRKLPEILAETRVRPEEVLVDYTGGTKTMSAALVLAASELFQSFSYVGGEQREKGGLGVTLEGRERMVYQGNPWTDLAIREVERSSDLWAGCQFEAAANVLRKVAPRVPHRLRFEALAGLSEAMAARHRLDFREAQKALGIAQKSLAYLFDGCQDHGILKFVSDSMGICTACSKDSANDILLRELLDNTLRTASQGRFEDAAARLYRAMEMQGQLWLSAATDNAFVNGRCKSTHVEQLSEAIRSLPFCDPHKDGEIRLSLEQMFRVLAVLGHPAATVVTADLDLETKSRWRTATEMRNTSILAHGVSAIRHDGFDRMRLLAHEFLGLDTTRVANPIPPMDPRWFD